MHKAKVQNYWTRILEVWFMWVLKPWKIMWGLSGKESYKPGVMVFMHLGTDQKSVDDCDKEGENAVEQRGRFWKKKSFTQGWRSD